MIWRNRRRGRVKMVEELKWWKGNGKWWKGKEGRQELKNETSQSTMTHSMSFDGAAAL